MSIPQQRMRQRQQPGLSPTDQHKLKTTLNTTYADDMTLIAQHFGNPHATRARITDIDAHGGVTLEWETSSTDGSATEDMQFAVRGFDGTSSVVRELGDLATEAMCAISQNPSSVSQLSRAQHALDARVLVDFAYVQPSILVMSLVAIGMSALTMLAVSSSSHPLLKFVHMFVSQSTCYYVLVGVIIVHFLEACVVCAVCQLVKTFQPRQMDTRTQVQWTVGGALFGLFCLHAFASKIMRQFALAESMQRPGQT
ncbi:hypothetical protein LPJ69_002223 [Coemansia sp. RSA 1752]|nr:hypothetical protein LPJ69_002223 [Coemansia sp. RSA 1752]KAJ2444255.1 hypothetical protein IWW46_002116 [Coemansia sp. RSA 2440]